jgi:hypothetical protein
MVMTVRMAVKDPAGCDAFHRAVIRRPSGALEREGSLAKRLGGHSYQQFAPN